MKVRRQLARMAFFMLLAVAGCASGGGTAPTPEELPAVDEAAIKDGAAEREAASLASCETLLSKFETIGNLGVREGRAEGFVRLYGVSARENAMNKIENAFPFILEAAATLEVEHGATAHPVYNFDGQEYVLGKLVNYLFENTSYDGASYSVEELQELLTDPEASSFRKVSFVEQSVRTCFEKTTGKEFREAPQEYRIDMRESVLSALQHTYGYLGCERDGFLVGHDGPIACAETNFKSETSEQELIEGTRRNPFENPVDDITLRMFDEFAYCYELGLSVNTTRTGCD